MTAGLGPLMVPLSISRTVRPSRSRLKARPSNTRNAWRSTKRTIRETAPSANGRPKSQGALPALKAWYQRHGFAVSAKGDSRLLRLGGVDASRKSRTPTSHFFLQLYFSQAPDCEGPHDSPPHCAAVAPMPRPGGSKQMVLSRAGVNQWNRQNPNFRAKP